MRKDLLALLLCLGLAVSLCACRDAYGACVKADADIAQGISSGLLTVTQLQQQGLLSSAEALNVAGYLEFANKADEAFGICAQEAHQAGSKAGSFTACATTFNSTLNTPSQLELLHVNNPKGSQQVTVIVTGITTGVTSVIAALGGA